MQSRKQNAARTLTRYETQARILVGCVGYPAVLAAVWIATDPSGQSIVGNRESYRLLRMKEGSNQSHRWEPKSVSRLRIGFRESARSSRPKS